MAINVKGSGGSVRFSGTGGSFRSFSTGGGSVSPIVPDTLAGLVAWFKADSLALNNDDVVTYWQDDSVNANHLDSIEPNSTWGPRLNSSDALLNNMPSVNFTDPFSAPLSWDGIQSIYKTNPTGLPTGDQPSTMYVVGYWDGSHRQIYQGDFFRGAFGWGNNDGPGKRMGLNFGEYGLLADSWLGASTTRPIEHESPFIFSFPYSSGGFSSPTTYLNGKSVTGPLTNNDGANTGTPNIPSSGIELAIGRIPTVGAVQHRWRGNIAEVILFNNAHDSATRQGIEKYLSNKYGIPVVNAAEVTPPRTNLVGWWRMDTIGKYADGADITKISDSSDWGNHIDSNGGFGGINPSIDLADPDMNNQTVATFVNDSYSRYGGNVFGLPTGNPNLTMYVVAKTNVANNNCIFYWGHRSYLGEVPRKSVGFVVRDSGGTPYVALDIFGASWGGLPIQIGEPFVAAWAHTAGADVTEDPLYVNGLTGTSIVSGVSGSLNLENNAIAFGTGGLLGSENRFDGNIGEVLVYAEKHDSTTMTNITNYLKTKYGIV